MDQIANPSHFSGIDKEPPNSTQIASTHLVGL